MHQTIKNIEKEEKTEYVMNWHEQTDTQSKGSESRFKKASLHQSQ